MSVKVTSLLLLCAMPLQAQPEERPVEAVSLLGSELRRRMRRLRNTKRRGFCRKGISHQWEEVLLTGLEPNCLNSCVVYCLSASSLELSQW